MRRVVAFLLGLSWLLLGGCRLTIPGVLDYESLPGKLTLVDREVLPPVTK